MPGSGFIALLHAVSSQEQGAAYVLCLLGTALTWLGRYLGISSPRLATLKDVLSIIIPQSSSSSLLDRYLRKSQRRRRHKKEQKV